MARGVLGFVAFSVVCSAVYLLNDIIDLEADRTHETKRMRSLAAGGLSIKAATILAFVLLTLGLSLSWSADLGFLSVIVNYIIANLAYSTWFKRVIMLDVVILASFYTLRLLAGGAVTAIACSEWLLAFSIFFFFCLAMVKRYSELRRLDVTEVSKGSASARPDPSVFAGRGYRRSDREVVATFGAGSGLISVLILILYVMSPEVRILYRRPSILLLLCPLFLYGLRVSGSKRSAVKCRKIP